MQQTRGTWNNRQVWPWSTKWGRAKANRVLPRKCIGHRKHSLPPSQETNLHMDLTREILKSDWLHSLQQKIEKLYTLSKNKNMRGLWFRSWALIAKFRLKLKKVGRPLSSVIHHIWHFATPWTEAHQASLSITNSWSLLKLNVHQVSEAIQPSHPLSSPSPPAFNISWHQSLFQWVNSSHQVAKVLELQVQHQFFQWIVRTDFL